MNKARRKELAEVIQKLNQVRDKSDLYNEISTLEDIKSDEESYYDNIPENLQYSQRAEASEEAIDNLDEALDLLNEVYDMDEFDKDNDLIQQAISKIENARW